MNHDKRKQTKESTYYFKKDFNYIISDQIDLRY